MAKTEFPDSLSDLDKLCVGENAIKTSDGSMYCGEHDVWARDRAITGEDLIGIRPNMAEKAILDLAKFQGVVHNADSGEEPGKIHTEHREIFNNKRLRLLVKLGISFASGVLWKTGWKQYTNYFSSDTTPLFIKIVSEYARIKPSILDKKVVKKDGSIKTIRQSVIDAARYIESTVSFDGLIRIKERNTAGTQYRYWRDGPGSFRDEFSMLPNIGEMMVILDIQFLAAEALDDAAKISGGLNFAQAYKWHDLAKKVRNAVIDNLWMEDEKYFAYGLDQDERGNLRRLNTIQSNPGWMLNSDFFDRFSETARQKYMTGIILRLFSDNMLTDAGIRCRSKKYMHDRNFHTYHGSWVTWPVDSYMIAKGLRRQGFPRLADQIEARFINAVNAAKNNYEFFIVDEHGNVLLNPFKKKQKGMEILPIEMVPEKTIAWTVTATLRANKERQIRQATKPHRRYAEPNRAPWIRELEDKILSEIDNQPICETNRELRQIFKQEPNIFIDQRAGLTRSGVDLIRKVGLKLVNQLAGRLSREDK